MNTRRFEGQSWIVVGGTRGIGLAVAMRASSEGAHVRVASRFPPPNLPFEGFTLDVTDSDSVEAFFDQMNADGFQPQVVVNAAGALGEGLAVSMSVSAFEAVLATNLQGPFLVCRRAIEEMLGCGGGNIVNIASFADQGLAGQVAYASAKAGLVSMTRALAKEVGRCGIRVNAVVPGFVHTRMTASLPVTLKDGVASMCPAGRFGTAEEIAATVCFVASDAASFVHGVALPVTGGLQSCPVVNPQ